MSSTYLGTQRHRGVDQVVLAKNDLFTANLTAAIRGFGKHALGALAAEALHMAIMDGTKHDSSRAAANWDLAFSGRNMRTNLDPAHYMNSSRKGEDTSLAPIGFRGDDGANKQAVWDYKQMVYGIQHANGFYSAKKGGWIRDELGIGLPNQPPRVELFNPIAGEANPRMAGQTGYSYAYYALQAGDKEFSTTIQGSTLTIGDKFIPWALQILNQTVQSATAQGRKFDGDLP